MDLVEYAQFERTNRQTVKEGANEVRMIFGFDVFYSLCNSMCPSALPSISDFHFIYESDERRWNKYNEEKKEEGEREREREKERR